MTTTQFIPSDGNAGPTARWWFLPSVVGVVLLLAGLVFVLFMTGDEPGETPAPATASCSMPESDATGITGIPDTGWKWVGSGDTAIASPFTPDAGPTKTDGVVPSCFARSPEGAVFAASAVVALSSSGNEYPLYRDFTATGALRDELLAETPERTEPYAPGTVLDGFKLVDYDRDAATVEVVASHPEYPGYASAVIDVVWESGDWVYSPPSSKEPITKSLETLDGYNEFRKGE